MSTTSPLSPILELTGIVKTFQVCAPSTKRVCGSIRAR